jgi:hypothetical protein|tara:strand:+ start:9593 stop:10522 length:930 start_codon:yes stop_codon:yes gene_type:complete
MRLTENNKVSDNLDYHLKNQIFLTENVFRPNSKKFFDLIFEVRELYNKNLIRLNEKELEIIESDFGKIVKLTTGEEIYLEVPMINEEAFSWDGTYANEIDEQGEDTYWSDDEDKITLQDILELTKDVKIINLPTKKIANIVLNWDNNPEEIERISQVEVSSQYPILIMVDEYGKIKWILDGNHRAQKALRSNLETIPAKLIRPSNLNLKSKKIFGLTEAEYKGKDVSLNKPKTGGPKKWYVYVKNPSTGKIKKVSYGSPDMSANWNDTGARKSFAARHRCDKKKDKTKAGYWACRAHKDFGKNVPGRFW